MWAAPTTLQVAGYDWQPDHRGHGPGMSGPCTGVLGTWTNLWLALRRLGASFASEVDSRHWCPNLASAASHSSQCSSKSILTQRVSGFESIFAMGRVSDLPLWSDLEGFCGCMPQDAWCGSARARCVESFGPLPNSPRFGQAAASFFVPLPEYGILGMFHTHDPCFRSTPPLQVARRTKSTP